MNKNKTSVEVLEMKDQIGSLVFSIEEYQRAYVWEIENIFALLESIINDRYFGAATFKRKERDSDSDKQIIEIVDGQQRITSLALIFSGTKIENTDIEFEFNITDPTKNELLKQIINGNEILPELQEVFKSSHYLMRMQRIKKEVVDKLPKYLEKNDMTLEEVWRKTEFIMIGLGGKESFNSFMSLNSNGIEVGLTELYKATLLKTYKDKIIIEKDESKKKQLASITADITQKWNEILDVFYFLRESGHEKILLDNLFEQSFLTMLNEKDPFISQNFDEEKGKGEITKSTYIKRGNYKKYINIRVWNRFHEYALWAKKTLPILKNNGKTSFIHKESKYLYQLDGSMNYRNVIFQYMLTHKQHWDEHLDSVSILSNVVFDVASLFSEKNFYYEKYMIKHMSWINNNESKKRGPIIDDMLEYINSKKGLIDSNVTENWKKLIQNFKFRYSNKFKSIPPYSTSKNTLTCINIELNICWMALKGKKITKQFVENMIKHKFDPNLNCEHWVGDPADKNVLLVSPIPIELNTLFDSIVISEKKKILNKQINFTTRKKWVNKNTKHNLKVTYADVKRHKKYSRIIHALSLGNAKKYTSNKETRWNVWKI